MIDRKQLAAAQRFNNSRLVTAIVSANPDRLGKPAFAHIWPSMIASILATALISALMVVLGIIHPSNNSQWRKPNQLIHELDTGNSYVYDPETDQLLTFTDLASAKIYAGFFNAGEPRKITVNAADIREVAKSSPIGIPKAPLRLPTPEEISAPPIQICSTVSNNERAKVTVTIGALENTADTNAGIVVQRSDGRQYLVFDGVTHQLYQPKLGKLSPLARQLGVLQPTYPSDKWIDTLPIGDPIFPPEIFGFGNGSAWGGKIGDAYFSSENGQDQYFVMLHNGLARISYLNLVAMGEKYRQHNIAVTPLSKLADRDLPVVEGGLNFYSDKIPGGKITVANPPLDQRSVNLCANFLDKDSAIPQVVFTNRAVFERQNAPSSSSGEVDFIVTTPGKALLLKNPNSVAKMPEKSSSLPATKTTNQAEKHRPDSPTPDSGTTYLVVDSKRYGIADLTTLTSLGYQDRPVKTVTSGLIKMLPNPMPNNTALGIEYIRPAS